MKKRFLSFSMRLFLAYIFMVILPIVAAGFLFIYNNVRDSRENQMYLLEKYSKKNMDSLEAILLEADKIVKMQFVDEDVLNALAADCRVNTTEYVNNSQVIESAINTIFLYNFDVRGIYLENMAHQFYEVSYTLFFRDMIKENLWKWGEEAKTQPNQRKIMLQRSKDNALQSVLLIHTLKDINRNRELGYVCAEIGFKPIASLLESLQTDSEHVLLLDEQKNLLYDSGLEEKEKTKNIYQETRTFFEQNEFEEKDSVGGNIMLNGTSYMVSATRSQECGWILVSYMKNPVFHFSSVISLLVFLGIFLLTSALDLVLSMFFSRRLTTSIHNLCLVIENCADGDIRTLDVQDSLFEDEIKMLLRSYNQLAIRLKASAEKEYRQKLHEKMMELRMLQAQINPHFLYNTLNAISSIANIHQIDSIRTISNNIAGMLRYSIKSPALVTIQDEVIQVCRYLDIQKVRLPDKILLDIEIAPEVLEVCCPVFTLQPVVENAILHGIEPMSSGKGILQIYGYQTGEDVYLSVCDNGIGMSKEKLECLVHSFSQERIPEQEYESIGLCNVYQRIKLYYGEAYGMRVESREGEGTTVVLHIGKTPNRLMYLE